MGHNDRYYMPSLKLVRCLNPSWKNNNFIRLPISQKVYSSRFHFNILLKYFLSFNLYYYIKRGNYLFVCMFTLIKKWIVLIFYLIAKASYSERSFLINILAKVIMIPVVSHVQAINNVLRDNGIPCLVLVIIASILDAEDHYTPV